MASATTTAVTTGTPLLYSAFTPSNLDAANDFNSIQTEITLYAEPGWKRYQTDVFALKTTAGKA